MLFRSGSPLDRPLAKVAEDVLQGYVSRIQAERCYGLVFREDGSIDADATAAQRARLRESGAMIALRDNEDAAATRPPEAGNSAEVFFTEGRLFPLRCC